MEWVLDFLQWWDVSRASVAIGAGTAIVGLGTLRANIRSQIQQRRPSMYAQLIAPSKPIDVARIEIGNSGPSTAYGVQVRFSPELPHPDIAQVNAVNDETMTLHILPTDMLRDAFSGQSTTWAPGLSAPYPFWVPRHDEAFKVSAEGIPNGTKVIFDYWDAPHHGILARATLRARKYTDSYAINTAVLRGVTYSDGHQKDGAGQ